ncbi:nephrin-like isoform X2 [Penaeus vannamei]
MYLGKKELQLTRSREDSVSSAWAEEMVLPSDNKKQVTCKVSSPGLPAPLAAHAALDLLFPPLDITGWATPSSAEPGHDMTLTCESSSSFPPSSITWHSKGQRQEGAIVSHTPGAFGGTVSRSELVVQTDGTDHGRTFTCEATNGLGVIVSTNITVNLLHGPVWLRAPSGRLDVKEGDDVTVTAVASANPPSVSYTWWRGPVALSRLGDSEGGVGTLRLRRLRRGQAGNYSVTAHTSRGAIHSSFFLNVQYGPEEIVATRRVLAEEGDTATLACSASGNPTPNITWTRASDNTSEIWRGVGEARLVLKEASRADTGLYLCHASSPVAAAAPVRAALVVTQPPTSATDIANGTQVDRWWAAVGDKGQLDCRVHAAPAPSFKWTVNDDRVIYTDRKYSISSPKLTDGVAEWSSVLRVRDVTEMDYTNYTCISRNALGSFVIHFSLLPPSPPATPGEFTAVAASATSVLLSWRSDPEEASIQGYSIRFHPSSSSHYLFQEEPGLNRSQVLVEGLMPATEYSFALQAYNNQGRSPFTPPSVVVTMLGVVEEAASSSSSSMGGASQQRVPRLILIIICLTGAALLILNIVIVSCFLRRYVFKKNAANARKPTTYSVYTPSTTPGSTTYGDLMSLNPSVPPPEYQQVRRDTDSEGTSTNTLRASFGSPQKSSEPLCVQVLNVSEEGATSLEGPASSQEDPYPQTRIAPPQIHVTPPHAHAAHAHDEQRRASDGSVVSTKSPAPTKQEQCAYSDASCSRVMNPSSFGEFAEQDNLGARSVCQSSNIPDVCPTTLTSYEMMLPPRQVPSCQEVIPEFPEDEEDEEEQEGDIKDANAKSTAVHEGSHTQYTSCQKHVPGSRFVNSPDSSPRRASVVQHHSGTPPTPRHNPATTARPSSQVIFHGQPHIQQQYEEQRLQQDVQQNTHPTQYTCPCYQQEPPHPQHHTSQPSYPHDPQYQQHFKKYTAHQVLDHPLQPLHHPQSFYPHGEDSEDLRQREKEPHLRPQVECHPDFEHPAQRPSSHPTHRPPPHHQEVSPSYRHVEASPELHQLDVHPHYHQYSPHYPSHCPQGAHQLQHSVPQEPSGVLDPSGLYTLQTNCCEERCGLSSVAESLPATELALCGQDLHSTT